MNGKPENVGVNSTVLGQVEKWMPSYLSGKACEQVVDGAAAWLI